MNKFEELIEALSETLQVPLHAERGSSCKLLIDGRMDLSIECDSSAENILLGCLICDVPPGRFRELLFKETLRMNAHYPRPGTFAYSERASKLCLYQYIPFVNLSSLRFSNLLEEFLEFADAWRRAIDSGNLSSVALPPPDTRPSPMGLR
jgi:hypothetical protein